MKTRLKPVRYHSHPTFLLTGSRASLVEAVPDLPVTGHFYEPGDLKTARLPSYVMSAELEAHRFLQLNYAKFRFNCSAASTDSKIRQQASKWRRRIEEVHEYLVTVNMPLVYSTVQRVKSFGVDNQEAISEAQLVLLRCIDGFNVGRGFKFSTYYVRSAMKAIFRHKQKQNLREDRVRTVELPEVLQASAVDRKEDTSEDVAAMVKALRDNAADLNTNEQLVLRRRYGLQDCGEPETLERVGDRIGMTKERVRQIQIRAQQKLAAYLAPLLES